MKIHQTASRVIGANEWAAVILEGEVTIRFAIARIILPDSRECRAKSQTEKSARLAQIHAEYPVKKSTITTFAHLFPQFSKMLAPQTRATSNSRLI
jgi:hypothetical protein